MALVVKDRVRVSSSSSGTGPLTLGAAVTGFQDFSVIGNGNTTYYTIVDPATGDWEVGIGTYSSTGPSLARNTVLESSDGGTAVNFVVNPKDVFVTYPAERSVYVDGTAISPATAARLGFDNLAQGSALSVLGVTGNATANVDSVAAASDHQVLRRSGTAVGFGAVALNQTNAVTGTLPVANGGTGATTLTSNNVLLGNGTGALQSVAPSTSGNVLTSDGTTWESAAPPSSAVNYPQNSQSAAYTLVLADAGKLIFHPSADTTARTFTIPSNASVAYPIGTAIKFINQNGAGIVIIDITTDTVRLSPEGTTGKLALAANGSATAIKVTSTEWLISGVGLSEAPPTIGQAYEGGFYAGQISVAGNGVASHYLVIGPVASAQNASVKWKNASTATTGADSVIDGPTNTADMVADGTSTVYPAAHFCNDLSIGGFTDWYMPAKNELEVCYYNLKPSTQSNTSGSGTNTNAVPSRGSNYTSGTPAQTSAADFKDTGAEDFAESRYWSSTEASATTAWRQTFFNGSQYIYSKASSGRVRAVRRVAV